MQQALDGDTGDAQAAGANVQGTHQDGAAAIEEVLGAQDLLAKILQNEPVSSSASGVARAWRQAFHRSASPQMVPPNVMRAFLLRVVEEITGALECCELREQGVECVACNDEPDRLSQTACLGCGAPIRIRNLSDGQNEAWIGFIREQDYEGFDAWLPLNNYLDPDQAKPNPPFEDHPGQEVVTTWTKDYGAWFSSPYAVVSHTAVVSHPAPGLISHVHRLRRTGLLPHVHGPRLCRCPDGCFHEVFGETDYCDFCSAGDDCECAGGDEELDRPCCAGPDDDVPDDAGEWPWPWASRAARGAYSAQR